MADALPALKGKGIDLGCGYGALATVVLQLLAFRVVDALLTGLPQRIEHGEAPAAIVLVGAKLATALILAAALTG